MFNLTRLVLNQELIHNTGSTIAVGLTNMSEATACKESYSHSIFVV